MKSVICFSLFLFTFCFVNPVFSAIINVPGDHEDINSALQTADNKELKKIRIWFPLQQTKKRDIFTSANRIGLSTIPLPFYSSLLNKLINSHLLTIFKISKYFKKIFNRGSSWICLRKCSRLGQCWCYSFCWRWVVVMKSRPSLRQ